MANTLPPFNVLPLQRFFEAAQELFVGLGEDDSLQMTNPAWERILGWSAEDLRDRPWLEGIHPEDRDLSRAALQALAPEAPQQQFESRYRHRDGGYCWLHWSLFWGEGGDRYGIAQDVTRQRRLEKALTDLRDRLETEVEERTAELCQVNAILRQEIRDRQRADAALQESEHRFRVIFESTAIGISIVSLDRLILEANPAFWRMVGYEPEELVGHSFMEITHPDDRGNFHLFQSLKAGDRDTYQLEKRYICKDGRVLWVSLTVTLVRNLDYEPQFVIVVVKDISSQRQTEERVRLLESVVVYAKDAILITEVTPLDAPHGPKIIYTNQAFTAMTGYSATEAIGQTPRLLQGSKTDPRELRKIRVALETWQSVHVEMINYRRDGSEFWVEMDIIPIANAQGTFTHWVAFQRDISDRKAAETALRLTQFSVDRAADAVFWTNPDGRFFYVNEAACRLLGYTRQELLGMSVSDVDPHCEAEKWPEYWASLKLCGSRTVESINCTKQGLLFPVEVTSNYLQFGGQEYKCAFVRDMTRRKELEHNLQDALSREKELSELKSRFVAMVSHEIRTPLSTILFSSHMLENHYDRLTDEKKTRYFQRIQSAISHLSQLLNDVLTISKAEAGRLEFQPEFVDIVALCQEIVEDLQITTHPTHQIEFVTMAQVQAVWLDAKLLRHLLMNLLVNAIKYSPDGGSVQVRLEWSETAIALAVTDQGIGIPEADQSRLFSAFHRGSNVGAISGTGLGLSIVKQCVDLHNGRIEVVSAEGQGTTFTVWLPRSPVPPRPAP
ncbi:PAS domain S-box protein [Geitlerinema sp. PCC 7407]|uniref:PAS domain-containing sensor histidine kinase n=1 Tax=Geitlerinema sp. PCC 7407 TaxID=1173025 RepID=UPI00029FAFA8|nr:PAS domain S-box protein [Geitlerinema sp. PCC 7407]AFY67596.1 PAS/PAC sensor signal transduction histidine kinase [Geitlerinema sp. PCC 7407]